MKRILCIWLPNWPLQRLLVARPELNGRAIVLHARLAGRGQQVVACSTKAASGGVRPSMLLADATALLRGTENVAGESALHVEAHYPQADREALLRLAQWCERYSPLVGLEEGESPESLLLDITGLGHLFGEEQGLIVKVQREMQGQGYAIRLAIADTIGMAWAWAHFADALGTTSPGAPQPPGMVPPNKRDAADPLPIEALRLSPGVAELLHRLGIVRIEQLKRLPRAGLASRVGDEPGLRLDQLTGEASELIVACRPLTELAAHWSLEHPTAHRETINQIVARLLERLTDLVARSDRGIVELKCQLDCEGNQPVCLEVGLFRPAIEPRHLLELIQLRLDRVIVPGPVHNVQVMVSATAQLVWRQGELFTTEDPASTRHLALLVDRLSSRLGPERVVRPQLQPSPQPERSFRYVPLAGSQARGKRPCRAAPTRLNPLQRPLRLFSPPRVIEAMSVAPDGPLIGFRYHCRQHRIARHWGPERIETGWWRGRSIQRDYYRVETDRGERFWVFRRLTDGAWFLHGEFI